jgi:hypothetical protein
VTFAPAGAVPAAAHALQKPVIYGRKGIVMALNTLQDKLGLSSRSTDVQRQLDDAVAESFPASDPVSLAQPHDREELGHSATMPLTNWLLIGGGLLAVIALIALRR